jgi:hypothetical protein
MGRLNQTCKGFGIRLIVRFANRINLTLAKVSTKRLPEMNASSRLDHFEILRIRLEVLKREHRDLDDAIHALQERPTADPLMLRRLKKQKLALKDRIAQIEDEIFPDIIA